MLNDPISLLKQAVDEDLYHLKHPELALIPAGGLVGAATHEDKVKGGLQGALTGGGAAAGAMLGKSLGDHSLVGGGLGGLAAYIAATKALNDLFPDRESKKHHKNAGMISNLKDIKHESDRGNYSTKHSRLRELMLKYPDDWKIDSELNSKYVGVTHVSGFQFHAPRAMIPQVILAKSIPSNN